MNDILTKLKQAYGASFNPYATTPEALDTLRRDVHAVISEMDAALTDDFVRNTLKNNFKQPEK